MPEKRLDQQQILDLDSMFRRYFINSVEGYKNVALIGTCNSEGGTNVALFNSIVHIGATPPLIGFIHRPVSVPKQTFTNIQSQECFTINLVHEELMAQAHQTSARFAPDESEFTATGLTPSFSDSLKAPYVRESKIRFGLSLEEILPIPSNGTYLIIGRVEEMFLPEELIDTDGYVELSKANIIACAGLDSYYLPHPLGRYEYAKPDQPVRKKS